jgi:hypothetical protein
MWPQIVFTLSKTQDSLQPRDAMQQLREVKECGLHLRDRSA